jgi:hydroxyacyl-ACP dehydratase HTD2-like protein with hotdog domain
MFSAVTWNRHKIHFDKDQAAAEGFPDVAVQRGLIGNYLAQLVTSWAGQAGHLRRLHWRVTKSAFPEQELRCQGIITDVAKLREVTRVDCALRILNPEFEQVATGDARVRFVSDSTKEGTYA